MDVSHKLCIIVWTKGVLKHPKHLPGYAMGGGWGGGGGGGGGGGRVKEERDHQN